VKCRAPQVPACERESVRFTQSTGEMHEVVKAVCSSPVHGQRVSEKLGTRGYFLKEIPHRRDKFDRRVAGHAPLAITCADS